MKKINLKSSEISASRKKSSDGNTSLLIGVFLIIVSLSVYGGVFYLKTTVKDEALAVNDEITKMKESIPKDEIKDFHDFQSRLSAIEALLGAKIRREENLNKISMHTLSETRFIKLIAEIPSEEAKNFEKARTISEIKKIDLTKIEATIVVPDHYILAQQLEAYSSAGVMDRVLLSNSKQEEEGVEAKITFVIK